jgi:phosphate transport system substrate-binding protein
MAARRITALMVALTLCASAAGYSATGTGRGPSP